MNAPKWWATVGLILLLMAGSGAAAWKWQANSYGKRLSDQTAAYQADLATLANAGAGLLRTEQGKRLALEDRLSRSDQTHHQELTNAQDNQTRLRDRLATADLRLSVLLDSTATNSLCGVQSGTGSIGVVHGATRAELDPAHAQRIVGITGDGDQGLIALAACQAYAREVSAAK